MSACLHALIDKARAVRIEEELARRGYPFWTAPRHNDLGQPCPLCGGIDRSSANTKSQIWNCRGCRIGGDVIKLVQHLDGVSFGEAVRLLSGQAAASPITRWQDEAKQKASADKVRAEENTYKLGALRVWRESASEYGTGLVARYLREERGIAISPDDWNYLSPRVIRFHPRCPFDRTGGRFSGAPVSCSGARLPLA